MIRITVPNLGAEEAEEIRKVLASGYLVQGPVVERFEKELGRWTGGAEVVAVSSGTAALHLALLSLGIGPGDEVVTSAFSFPATANAIELAGARPVFVDIEPGTFNIDASAIKARLGPRTKAILPVHEFGLMADMEAVASIAKEAGVPVVEDAACALGAWQMIAGQKIMAGAAGTIGCFSFHPRKSITTGEGGAMAVFDGAIARRLRLLRNHGLDRGERGFDIPLPGLNYRLTEMQAAMGCAQAAKFESMLQSREVLAQAYDRRLSQLGLQVPSCPQGRGHSYQSYVVLLAPGQDRDEVAAKLKDRGIEAVRGAYGMHKLSYYQKRYGFSSDMFPEAAAADDRALALPIFPTMTLEQVEEVSAALRSLLKPARKAAAAA